jgi:hypothetical protein
VIYLATTRINAINCNYENITLQAVVDGFVGVSRGQYAGTVTKVQTGFTDFDFPSPLPSR